MKDHIFKKNKKLLAFFFGLFLSSLLFTPAHVFAKKTINDAERMLRTQVAPQTGINTQDLSTHAGALIQGSLRIVGIAFLVLMVYGGLRWMSARGNETDIEAAKETIIAAIIGLMVVVGAYAITNFVTQRLIQKQQGGAGGFEDGPAGPGEVNGCCEFKVNTIPTWTAFMMTERACKASCMDSLGDSCTSNDWGWDKTTTPGECEAKRQDALR